MLMSECRTDACDRDATHYVELPHGRGWLTGSVCTPCLRALELGIDSQISDRQDIETECLPADTKLEENQQ
jgi:hypothetical protein